MKNQILIESGFVPELSVGSVAANVGDVEPFIMLAESHFCGVLSSVAHTVVGKLKKETTDPLTLVRKFLVTMNSPAIQDIICGSVFRNLVANAAVTFDHATLDACRSASSEIIGFDSSLCDKKTEVPRQDTQLAKDLYVLKNVRRWLISVDKGFVRLNVLKLKDADELNHPGEFHESFSPYKKAVDNGIIFEFNSKEEIEQLPLDTQDGQYIYVNAVIYSKRMLNPLTYSINVGDLTESMLLNCGDTPQQVGNMYAKILSRTAETHSNVIGHNHSVGSRVHDMWSFPSSMVNFVMTSNVAANTARILSKSEGFRQAMHSLVSEVHYLIKRSHKRITDTEWSRIVKKISASYCETERQGYVPGKLITDTHPTSVNDKSVRKFFSLLKLVRHSVSLRGGWMLRRLATEFGGSVETATRWMSDNGRFLENDLGRHSIEALTATHHKNNRVITSRTYVIRRICEDLYMSASRLPGADGKGEYVEPISPMYMEKLFKLMALSHTLYLAQLALMEMTYDIGRRCKCSHTMYETSVLMLGLIATMRTAFLADTNLALRGTIAQLSNEFSDVSHKVEKLLWSSLSPEKWDEVCSKFTDSGFMTSLLACGVHPAGLLSSARSFCEMDDNNRASDPHGLIMYLGSRVRRLTKEQRGVAEAYVKLRGCDASQKPSAPLTYVWLALKQRGGIVKLDEDVCTALSATSIHAKYHQDEGVDEHELGGVYDEFGGAISIFKAHENDFSVHSVLDMYALNSGLNGTLVFLKMLMLSLGANVRESTKEELIDVILSKAVLHIGSAGDICKSAGTSQFNVNQTVRLLHMIIEVIAPSLDSTFKAEGGSITQNVRSYFEGACLNYINECRGYKSLPNVSTPKAQFRNSLAGTQLEFVSEVMEGMDAIGDALLITKGLMTHGGAYNMVYVTTGFYRGMSNMLLKHQ